MIVNISLIFIFWSLPCLIYYYTPFGSSPNDEMLNIMIWTNLALYIPCILWIVNAKKTKRFNHYKPVRSAGNTLLQVLILILNLGILQSVSFVLGIEDDSIRTVVYENAGIFWSLLVALYSLSFVIIGMCVGEGRINNTQMILTTANSIIFFSYGMKAGIVQIILSFLAGWFITKKNKSWLVLMRNLLIIFIIIMIGFWAINSLRLNESIPLAAFVELIYLYIAPNFTNFSNILHLSFDYEYIFGGIFGGVYKLLVPGYYDPLTLVSQDYLEYKTWNVWSYLTTLYVSGGYFEVYIGSLLIGIYTTASLYWYKNYGSLLSAVNLSQVILLLLFLHNQYYHSSFAPYLAIGLAWLVSLFIYQKDQKSQIITALK